MLVGYARTSTADQVAGLEAQLRDLKAAGAEKIFSERVSSVAHRAQLDAALDFVREGDCLMVCKLDRLGRSNSDLKVIIAGLVAKGIGFKVLAVGGEPLDTRTATGKLLLGFLGELAEFERAMMLERQREGIEKAKAEGRYHGRPITIEPAKVAALVATIGAAAAAKQLGCARSSIYRVVAQSAKVIELRTQGRKPDEIAKALRIAPKSVGKILAEAAKAA